MVQDLHLTCALLLCFVLLYVLLSLLLAVVVGRFISLGKGPDHCRACPFHPLINLSSGSSGSPVAPSSGGEGPGTPRSAT